MKRTPKIGDEPARVLAFRLPSGCYEQPAIDGTNIPSQFYCSCGRTYASVRALLTHRKAKH